MQLLFVMDPAASMLPDRDTSFALMRGAQARGHACWHCLPRDVELLGAHVLATARPISVSDAVPHVTLGEPVLQDLAALDAVWIRKDPPFDAAYLHLTQMLELVCERTLVVNAPRGLRDANEKLAAFLFPHLTPRTAVLADKERILARVDAYGGEAVIKSLDGAGGIGVLALRRGDKNVRGIIDLMTSEGCVQVVVQELLPEVAAGDKRVLLVDGELLGAILRVPRADDLRANIHVGGAVFPTTLTAREAEVVAEVGPALGARGLFFVGLDLIGERLIEVNVTSPTGLQELGRLTGTRPEETVMERLERRIAAQRSA